MIDIFPINIALGKAFCNRSKERTQLKQLINQGRHTVLIAPRRYGKTSLINQVLIELKLPCTLIELTLATSTAEVQTLIVKYVSDLLYKILPKTLKAKQKILALFKWLNPELVLTAAGQKLQFKPNFTKTDTGENIAQILLQLDKAAGLAKKRVVVVIDEFQQLSEIGDSQLEAAFRHAMQYSKHVSYVFSGSHRHMLYCMFNDKNRPFYNSCEIMNIERISRGHYTPFIQNAAKQKWGKQLPDDVLNCIFELSALHPSYVNRICGHFWLTNKMPTVNSVSEYWNNFVASRRSEFSEDLLNLSKNQKRVIAYLVKNPTAQPSDKNICNATELSEPSVRQSVKVLLDRDIIYRDSENILQVLDPALKAYINTL